MNKVKIKSQIWGRGTNELFDYQAPEKINQLFNIDTNISFYKNGSNLIKPKENDLNETCNPNLVGSEYLFSILKKDNSNEKEKKFFFISKANYPLISSKLSYHHYRINNNLNNKEKDTPTWISLNRFNYNIDTPEMYEPKKRLENFKKNIDISKKYSTYELNIGDVIKFGRVSLILSKIHFQKTKKKDSTHIQQNIANNDINFYNNNQNFNDIYNEFKNRVNNNKISIAEINNFPNKKEKNIDSRDINPSIFKTLTGQEENINGMVIKSSRTDRKIENISHEDYEIKDINDNDENSNKGSLNSRIINKIYKDKVFTTINNNSNFLDKTTVIDHLKVPKDTKISRKVSSGLKSNSEKNIFCRVCYCDEEESESPLINPCNCLGDVKYIHLNCIYRWLQIKSNLTPYSNDNCKQLCLNTVCCEICKKYFPEIIYDVNKRKVLQIFNYEKINQTLYNIYNNYVVFESFELLNQQKIIYILSFDNKNTLSIGRGQDCELRLFDVTVSRLHALLMRTKNNKLLIRDTNSKFGTLILLQAKKILITNKILPIQIGKTFLLINSNYHQFDCFSKFCRILCGLCKTKKKSKSKKSSIKSENSGLNKEGSLDNSNSQIDTSNFQNELLSEEEKFDYNFVNKICIAVEEILEVKFQVEEIMN